MTIDDARLRAIITDMMPIERAYKPTPEYWTDATVAAIYDNPEADRIMKGEGRLMTDAERAEVARIMESYDPHATD